jgi:hypothetical protein
LSIALDSTEAKFFNEFSTKVANDHLGRSNFESFSFDCVKVFLLADVGKETDDFISRIKKPTEDAACVQTT